MFRRRNRLQREGRGRFTVMLIPHSENRIVNLRITALALVVLAVLAFGIVSAFFYASTIYSTRARSLERQTEDVEQAREGLDQVRQSVSGLRTGAEEFRTALQPAFDEFDLVDGETEQQTDSIGDFAELERLREVGDEELLENLYVSLVSELLDDVADPLAELASIIEAEREFLANLPVIWPLESGRGRVERNWGPGTDPVTGEFSMNPGVRVWDVAGAPVLASAHGRVLRVDFDPDYYGWYLDIEHGYGFRTRYAHLQQIRVRSGDRVTQGQTIATVGETGRVVEPQLGFEIWLGTENVDPDAFLTVRSSLRDFAGDMLPVDLRGP